MSPCAPLKRNKRQQVRLVERVYLIVMVILMMAVMVTLRTTMIIIMMMVMIRCYSKIMQSLRLLPGSRLAIQGGLDISTFSSLSWEGGKEMRVVTRCPPYRRKGEGGGRRGRTGGKRETRQR